MKETILNRIKEGETFLNALEVNELALSLECNLSDAATLTYAKENFYSFYETKIEEYKKLEEGIKSSVPEEMKTKYLTKFSSSVEILELAFDEFKKRMEKVTSNE